MVMLVQIVLRLIEDALQWLVLLARSDESVRAENLVLRRQLAMFVERGIAPRRVDAATRVSLAVLTRLFYWRNAVVVVKPATIVRWHRAGWRLFWRMKSRPGRPPIPRELRLLIRRMGKENPLWAKSALPTSCCSSWACGSRRGPSASTCPGDLPASRAVINAGRHS